MLQDQPHGQAKLLDYEDLEVPDIESQEITLWSGKHRLGLVTVKDVISDHLGPGTMLSLRGGPPPKKSLAAPESYHYELRRLETGGPGGSSTRYSKHKRMGAARLYMDALVSPPRLQNLLEQAYNFLHPNTGQRFVPVEFHVKAHPQPHLSGLSLFTRGRVDLHPAVISRALPEGSFQVLKPKARDQVEALWVVAPKLLQMRSARLPRNPQEVASVVEELAARKRKWVKELVVAGDLTSKGILTEGGKMSRRQKFGLKQQSLDAQGKAEECDEQPEDSDDGR